MTSVVAFLTILVRHKGAKSYLNFSTIAFFTRSIKPDLVDYIFSNSSPIPFHVPDFAISSEMPKKNIVSLDKVNFFETCY
jgi:hypothetical protein